MAGTSKLLLDDYPLIVLPKLAVRVGLEAAIALQQLHYWTLNAKTATSSGEVRGRTVDEAGVIWISNSYEEWKENFPFWSVSTIKRIFADLVGKKLVVTRIETKGFEKRKFYRVDYEALDLFVFSSADSVRPSGQLGPTVGPNGAAPSGQLEPLSIETNPETKEAEARRYPAPRPETAEDLVYGTFARTRKRLSSVDATRLAALRIRARSMGKLDLFEKAFDALYTGVDNVPKFVEKVFNDLLQGKEVSRYAGPRNGQRREFDLNDAHRIAGEGTDRGTS